MMKVVHEIYAATLYAERNGGYAYTTRTGRCAKGDFKEIYDAMQEEVRTAFPPNSGWMKHNVTFLQVQEDWITDAVLIETE